MTGIKARFFLISSLVFVALVFSGCSDSKNNDRPQKNTEKTIAETEFAEEEKYLPFTATLENYSDKEFFLSPCPDFLNAEQKSVWQKAYYMTYMSVTSQSFGLSGEYEKAPRKSEDGNEYHYRRTGVSYDEMYDYIRTAFTKEYTEEIFLGDTYINDGGELLFCDRAREPDISYKTCDFYVVSQSGDKIKFAMTAVYSWKGIAQLGELDKTETETHYEEHFFTMVKTEDGWRMSEYSYWL